MDDLYLDPPFDAVEHPHLALGRLRTKGIVTWFFWGMEEMFPNGIFGNGGNNSWVFCFFGMEELYGIVTWSIKDTMFFVSVFHQKIWGVLHQKSPKYSDFGLEMLFSFFPLIGSLEEHVFVYFFSDRIPRKVILIWLFNLEGSWIEISKCWRLSCFFLEAGMLEEYGRKGYCIHLLKELAICPP